MPLELLQLSIWSLFEVAMNAIDAISRILTLSTLYSMENRAQSFFHFGTPKCYLYVLEVLT